MEGSVRDLSMYRFECALEDLDTSKYNLRGEKYNAAVNRSYYAIFHALRAVTILDGFDSKKHSGIIAFFNKQYVKEGVFDKKISRIIKNSFEVRSNADYADFYVVSKKDAEEQIDYAEELISVIKDYLEERWNQ